MRILIADDDPTGRAISHHLVARSGHAVEVAADGLAALEALARGAFDAALLDLYMPGMDGGAVARAVRDATAAGPRPRLIALTAAAHPGGADAILALGFDAFLTKPLNLAALSEALEGHAPPPTPPARPPRPGPPAPAAPAATAELVTALSAALAAGDAAAMATSAATLKAAASAGNPALAALAARLERALAAADDRAVAHLVRAIAAQ